ncbi:hypothetical protein [Phenylobacterium sp.]|uniref:hypothetical protein n=1 Tax=Phenylobacterium sp. TaxID=1871053 RepID=UPI002F947A99
MTVRANTLETIVFARAAAITLVVANHCVFGVSLHGGLNALLFVSGLAMAQFGFNDGTAGALRAFYRFGLRLAVPSFIIALFWGMAVGKVSAHELMFVSNWMYKSRVALFPIWYPQAIAQMLLALTLVFALTDMGSRIQRHRLFWTSALFVGSCAIALMSYSLWDTRHLADKLPHLIAWNFVLGWLCWAVRTSNVGKLAGRLLLTGVLAGSVLALFIGVNAADGQTRAIFMPLIILPVIWFDRISAPRLLARAAIVISQASLFIFLLHYYFFWGTWRLGRLIGLEDEAQAPVVRLFVGILGPVITWAVWTAARRVYRRGYRLPLLGERAYG